MLMVLLTMLPSLTLMWMRGEDAPRVVWAEKFFQLCPPKLQELCPPCVLCPCVPVSSLCPPKLQLPAAKGENSNEISHFSDSTILLPFYRIQPFLGHRAVHNAQCALHIVI